MDKTCSPVDRAISALGGPTQAAMKLGISNPSVISNWIARRQVPYKRVLEIADLTDIPPHELRPDLFPTHPSKGRAAQ